MHAAFGCSYASFINCVIIHHHSIHLHTTAIMKPWLFIQEKFRASVPVILLYVLHSEGSSPCRQDFKMAVAGDDSFCCSIGGGIMSHKFVEMAKAILAEEAGSAGVYRQVHDKAAGNNKSGMICSGEQTIFLYRV